MSVIQVTSREFRDRQAALFDLVDKGAKVIIRRRGRQLYALSSMNSDETSLSAETERQIKLSRKQYKAGNTVVCKTAEEAIKHLEAL